MTRTMTRTTTDLMHDDHKGVDLTKSHVANAEVTDADLTGAEVMDAGLTGAEVMGADLPDAEVMDAGLTDADLPGAALTGGDLPDADHPGAGPAHAEVTGGVLAAPGCTTTGPDAGLDDPSGIARGWNDAGMATAEYAIATVAAAGFAGLLLVILRSNEVRALLLGIIRGALSV